MTMVAMKMAERDDAVGERDAQREGIGAHDEVHRAFEQPVEQRLLVHRLGTS